MGNESLYNIENNIQDSKKNEWYGNNCLTDSNMEHIELILQNRNIEKWKLTPNGHGEYDLRIIHMGKVYKVQVREDMSGLVLLEKNSSFKCRDKEFFHKVKQAGLNGVFYDNNCWWNLIRWIEKRNKYIKEGGRVDI